MYIFIAILLLSISAPLSALSWRGIQEFFYGTSIRPADNIGACQVSQMTRDGDSTKTHPLLAYESIPGTPATAQNNTPDDLTQKINVHPDDMQLRCARAHAYLVHGDTTAARADYETVAQLDPDSPIGHYGVCYTRQVDNDRTQAIKCYDAVLQRWPQFAAAKFARMKAKLATGNYEEGWHELEPFLKDTNRNGDALRELLHTNNLAEKTIVLTAEGGFGDTYQFGLLAEELCNKGATVIAVVQKPLVNSLTNYHCFSKVIPMGSPLPEHDAVVSMMSLPAILNVNEKTLHDTPKLPANEKLVAYWKQQLAADKNTKVGICWSASVENDKGRLPLGRRSIPIELLAHAAVLPQLSLYGLPGYDGLEQLKNLSWIDQLKQFPADFDKSNGPFADTRAVVENLDAVITVDTGFAHFAARCGKKVLLVLPYQADFRWLEGADKNPWYSNVTIVQETKPNSPETVVSGITYYLRTLTTKA